MRYIRLNDEAANSHEHTFYLHCTIKGMPNICYEHPILS